MPQPRATRNNIATSDNTMSSLSIDRKLDLLLNDGADIKNSNNKLQEDMSQIKEDFKNFKSEINSSIEMCFNNLNDCKNSIVQNRNNIDKHEKEVDNLISENVKLKKEVDRLQSVVSAAEQYSRSNCLEVRGVPELKNEVIMDIVRKVARCINFNLDEKMIDAVHRLSKNISVPQAPRGIIIKFCRRLDLEEMRKKTRVKNGFSAAELGFQSESKIYISLSMTRETSALWKQTRDFKNERHYKYAWVTSTGKIFIRKDDGMRAVHIATKKDLDQLK